MHIHRLQNDPAFALNALYAAQQAEARQKAAETRRKLSEFASLLEGESEDCIVTLGERREDGSAPKDRRHAQPRNGDSDPEQDPGETQVSGWAW